MLSSGDTLLRKTECPSGNLRISWEVESGEQAMSIQCTTAGIASRCHRSTQKRFLTQSWRLREGFKSRKEGSRKKKKKKPGVSSLLNPPNIYISLWKFPFHLALCHRPFQGCSLLEYISIDIYFSN